MITMKKKLFAIIVGMMLCAELLGGCGNKNINKDNITTDTAEESEQQDSNKNRSCQLQHIWVEAIPLLRCAMGLVQPGIACRYL